MNYKKVILPIIIVVLLLMVYNIFQSSEKNVYKTDFKQTALFRNENNTGPINRLFAIAVEDTLWREMKMYARNLPYTKYGITYVYFFNDMEKSPSTLKWVEPHFNDSLKPHCIAVYKKERSGGERFQKYPYMTD